MLSLALFLCKCVCLCGAWCVCMCVECVCETSGTYTGRRRRLKKLLFAHKMVCLLSDVRCLSTFWFRINKHVFTCKVPMAQTHSVSAITMIYSRIEYFNHGLQKHIYIYKQTRANTHTHTRVFEWTDTHKHAIWQGLKIRNCFEGNWGILNIFIFSLFQMLPFLVYLLWFWCNRVKRIIKVFHI